MVYVEREALMDIDTGHLIDSEKYAQEKDLSPKALKDLLATYTEVPPELSRAAKQKLAGKAEAHVSLTSGGKLSQFAARVRKLREEREALEKQVDDLRNGHFPPE
jgi:hypothetical protein